jgi:deazaflavin-dependent oxidoreductase (nitroreductase family)
MSRLGRCRRAIAMLMWKVMNPVALRFAAGVAPWWVILETTGRKSGKPRRVPLARGPADERTIWLIAVHGPHASFVKNLLAEPQVRIKIRGRWLCGRAQLEPLDERRLSEFSRYARGGPRTMGIDPAFVRIDLDPEADGDGPGPRLLPARGLP